MIVQPLSLPIGGQTRWAWAVVLVTAWCGCGPSLETPDGLVLQCASDGQCPVPMVCNVTSGRCVAKGALDAVEPGLVAPASVMPSHVRHPGSATISFQVSEPLRLPPTLEFGTGGGVVSLSPVSFEGDQLPSYTFVYQTDGTELDTTSSLTASVEDLAGNRAELDLAAVIHFDNTAPTVLAGSAELEIFAPEATRVDSPTGATVGSTLRIHFTVSEALAAPPALSSTAGSSIRWDAGQSTLNRWTFEGVVADADAGNGPQGVQVVLSDLAGNQGTAALAFGGEPPFDDLILDTEPPMVPDVETAGAIILHRAPWGALAAGVAGAQASLSGSPGAVEAQSWVVVYADADGTVELARALADEKGSFGAESAILLGNINIAVAYVAAIDGAGNISPVVPVREMTLTATLAGRVARDDSTNPNRMDSRRYLAPILEQGSVLERDAASGIGAYGDDWSLSTEGAGSWRRLESLSGSLPAVIRHSVVFNPSANSLLFFGGEGPQCFPANRDIFEDAGSRWTRSTVFDPEEDGNPSNGVLLFAQHLGRIVLIGGAMDVWEWTGESWRQTCRSSACQASRPPPTNQGFAAAYDPERARVVVLGEFLVDPAGSDETTQTWEWSGQQWERKCSSSACAADAPMPRTGHTMAFDPNSHEVLVYGGNWDSDKTTLWSWDGARWARRCTRSPCSDSVPAPRRGHVFHYDPLTDSMMLFGGYPAGSDTDLCSEPYDHSTWLWNGESWTERTAAIVGGPPHSQAGALVYDPRVERMVYVGGSADEGWLCSGFCGSFWGEARQWYWDGARWEEVPLNQAQPVGVGFMTGDPETGSVILVGPDDGSGAPSHRTWTLQAGAWVPKAMAGPAPPLTGASVSTVGSEVLLFAPNGGSGDLWHLSSSGWSSICAQPGCPGPSLVGAAATASLGGELVLLTSSLGPAPRTSQTWTWNGSTWQQRCTSNCVPPAGRSGVELAAWADADAPVAVAMSGRTTDEVLLDDADYSRETWLFDGSDWTPVPDAVPSPREEYAMAYDPDRQRVVVHGGVFYTWLQTGMPGDIYYDGLYEWDGAAWLRREYVDPHRSGSPGAIGGHTMDYSHDLGGVVAYGGPWGTWVWDGAGNARPAHVVSVPLVDDAVGSTDTVKELVVDWYGSGVGYPAGSPVSGITLLAWDQLRWLELETTELESGHYRWSSAADPRWAGAPEGALQRLLHGLRRELYVAAVPTAANGSGDLLGEIETDYLEVGISYRR